MTTIPPTTFEHACDLATKQARRTMETWHVIDNGHNGIASDAEVKTYGYGSLYCVEVEAAFSAVEMDPPGDNPLGDDEGDSLLLDIHTVLSRCLSNDALAGVIPEIERCLHRVERALVADEIAA